MNRRALEATKRAIAASVALKQGAGAAVAAGIAAYHAALLDAYADFRDPEVEETLTALELRRRVVVSRGSTA